MQIEKIGDTEPDSFPTLPARPGQAKGSTEKLAVLNLTIPKSCPGLDDPKVLNPRNTWADPKAYDAAAAKLRDMFRENFRTYADQVSEAVRQAGPRG